MGAGRTTNRVLYTPHGYPVTFQYLSPQDGFKVKWLREEGEPITFRLHRNEDNDEMMLMRIDEKIHAYMRGE